MIGDAVALLGGWTLGEAALLGGQAVLGLVGLGAGGAKLAGQEQQVAEFERFGYPRWFRAATGLLEVIGGVALLAGAAGVTAMALAGGLLLAVVWAGAVVTHLRVDDPPSQTAVPAVLLVLVAGVAGYYLAGVV